MRQLLAIISLLHFTLLAEKNAGTNEVSKSNFTETKNEKISPNVPKLYSFPSHQTSSVKEELIYAIAHFYSPFITSSETSSYKVKIVGREKDYNPKGDLPKVPGLVFQDLDSPKIKKTIFFIDGTPKTSFEMTFEVKPDYEGIFIVPEWNLSLEGKTLKVPEARLIVESSSEFKKRKTETKTLQNLVFLHLDLPVSQLNFATKTECSLSLYVDNSVPVSKITAPRLEGESFSTNQLGLWNNVKVNQILNGKLYTIISWNVELIPPKFGSRELEFSIILKIPVETKNYPPNRDDWDALGEAEHRADEFGWIPSSRFSQLKNELPAEQSRFSSLKVVREETLNVRMNKLNLYID
jgi:hypothetical protein